EESERISRLRIRRMTTVRIASYTESWTEWSGPGAWGWLVLLPAALVARAAWSFTRDAAPRWPLRATIGYLPTAFTCYLLIGLGVTS
ncbi:hypothetical protein, partial [Streptomyces sp. NPDC023588]|uniref:hypothetical protein n=1 Tax=Streptomyces sp. NPDC023588 TaxID=3154907 RepID=UPI0034081864